MKSLIELLDDYRWALAAGDAGRIQDRVAEIVQWGHSMEQASRAVVPSVAVPEGAKEAIELLDIWQSWLGSSRARCDEQGKALWDRIERVRAMLAAAPAPQPGAEGRVGELCHNCATALPEGCKGIFRNDGDACALNRAAIAKGGEEGK